MRKGLIQAVKIFGAIAIAACISLVITRVYLQSGVPYTHDGENHLARFANYAVAVREGQFPPRFAPNLLNHYGYPVFNYNYPLANILSLPLSVIDIPYEMTFKILMSASLISGVLGMYHLLRAMRSSKHIAALGSLLWLSSPYLVSTVIYRGNIGEVMALGLTPWLLLMVERWRDKWSYMDLALGAVLWTVFFLSHNIAVLLLAPTVVLWALVRMWGQWQRLFKWSSTVLLGITGSLWFWLPALAEKKFIILDGVDLSTTYANHAPQLSQLISSPLQFGFSYPGPIDTLGFGLGIATCAVLLLALRALVIQLVETQKVSKLWVGFALTLTIGAVIMQLPFMMPVWEWIPFIRFVQFPWRLTMIVLTMMPLLLLWVSRNWSKTTAVLTALLILSQLVVASRVMPVDIVDKNDIDYTLFSQTTSTQNENLTKGFTYLDIGDWKARPATLSGSANFTVDTWRGSVRSYSVDVAEAPTTIVEPTMWFPGWETRVEGQMTTLIPETAEGRLAYRIDTPGTYQVHSQFTQNTWPRLVGNSVSLLTILAVAALGTWSGVRQFRGEE